ncbi:MAG: 16S rRNA (cytidine1402-2'-O)-methyltransferase [Halieaceae bacterium]|jgi:16S rRNA (cytidine1402-2'-O)-methyltransferase
MLIESALYVVATPIGNLSDMTPRAIEVLRNVDRVAAEDTRHSRLLFNHFSINTTLVAYHDHSEAAVAQRLLGEVERGASLALISDAGTPLISDPGYRLVSMAHELGIKTVPVPGASAVVAALSVSGLPADRFSFEGFIPSKSGARLRFLQALADESRTMIFYEAPHRISESLCAMCEAFGDVRLATVARELSKTFETVRRGCLKELATWVAADSNQQRGEIVVLVSGREKSEAKIDASVERSLLLLAAELPARRAAALTGEIYGISKNQLYRRLLELR